MMKHKSWVVAALASLSLAGCLDEESSLSSTGDEIGTFEEFKERTYREPWPGGAYIVDGDVAIYGDAQLEEFWASLQPGALAVLQYLGSDVKWGNAAKLNITYCVSNNFGSSTQRIIDAMEVASREWESRAAVNFVHIPAQDGSGCTNTNPNVVFNVQQVSVGGAYAASSFWPNYARSMRNLNVNVGTLGNTPAGLVGVLGHELGHTLGFRHEHTRPEAGICFEDNDWRGLTAYDSKSIMHYPQCNGGATFHWWTEKDRLGAVALYDVGNLGPADILWRNNAEGLATVWTMNANGTALAAGTPMGVSAGWEIQGHGDFDADGHADILWRHTDGTVFIWFMNGTIQLSGVTAGVVTNDWQIAGVGDFDGDGKSDVLWKRGSELVIWFMNGASRSRVDGVPPQMTESRTVVGIGDFNRDGTDDILWSGPPNNGPSFGFKVWLMDAENRIQEGVVLTTFGSVVKGIGDFNGDNHDDVLIVDAAGTLSMWFMDGVVRNGTGLPGSAGGSWTVQAVGDFNNDWKADILWRNSSNALQIWYMSGASQAASPSFPPSVSSTWLIKGADHFD